MNESVQLFSDRILQWAQGKAKLGDFYYPDDVDILNKALYSDEHNDRQIKRAPCGALSSLLVV